jgi:hypothetical protein
MQAAPRPRDLACLPGPDPARPPATSAPGTSGQRPFWIYVYDPERALMVSDGLNYIGQQCARKQAAKLARYYGQPTQVRPSPTA